MSHRVTLIPGDGIGPELTEATRRVLEATGVEFDWDVRPAGAAAMEAHGGNPLPDATLDSIRANDIEFEDRIVDNMCMQLVQRPEEYDMLVLPNLYGDVLSDLCAGMIGGLGLAPGANFGDGAAVFEPTHGSAPKYAGQNKTNPMAQLLSGMLMLRHLGEDVAAENLEAAVGASEVADAIIEKLGVRV